MGVNDWAQVSRMPYTEADFVRKWLVQEDLKAKFWPILITALTLLFAAIAAWPVIKRWLQ